MTFLAGRKVMWWTVKKGHFRRVRRGGGDFCWGEGGSVGRKPRCGGGQWDLHQPPPPWKPPPPPVSSGGDGVADTASASESPYLSMIARSQKKHFHMENICGHVPPRVEKGEKRKEGGAKSRACNSMCGVGWGVEMRGCGQTWGLGEWCLLGSSLFPSLGRCAPTPPPQLGASDGKKDPAPLSQVPNSPHSILCHPLSAPLPLQKLLHARVLLLLILPDSHREDPPISNF